MRKRRHLRNCKCLLKIYRVNISNWRVKSEQLQHSCSPFPAAESGSKGRFTPRVNTAYSCKAPLISAWLWLILSLFREENRSLCDCVAKAAKHAPPVSGHSRARDNTACAALPPSSVQHHCGSLKGGLLMLPGKNKAGGSTISHEVLGIAVQRIKLGSHSRNVILVVQRVHTSKCRNKKIW